MLNATVTQTASAGYLALRSGDSTGTPSTSSVNFTGPGQTVANLAFVDPDSANSIQVYNGSPGAIQYIIDLFGYFTMT